MRRIPLDGKSPTSKSPTIKLSSYGIYIPNTLFVDSKNGSDATAKREYISFPFQTLAAALNRAKAEDVIYVHPGSYVANSLILKNEVGWYFCPGSMVTSTSSSIFIDDASSITCTISGYGGFVSAYGILTIKNNSAIDFSADMILGTKGIIFDIKNGHIKLTLNDVIAENCEMLSIDGASTIILKCMEINGTQNLIHITENAIGLLDFSSNILTGGDEKNGLITSNSIQFTGNIKIDNLVFNCAQTQAFQFNVPKMGSIVKGILYQINIGTIFGYGGLLNITANKEVTFNYQPLVRWTSGFINLETTIEPFLIKAGQVIFSHDNFSILGLNSKSIFNVSHGSIVQVNGLELISDKESMTTVLYAKDKPTQVNLRIRTIILTGQLIHAKSASFNLSSQKVICDVTSKPIVKGSDGTININYLQLEGKHGLDMLVLFKFNDGVNRLKLDEAVIKLDNIILIQTGTSKSGLLSLNLGNINLIGDKTTVARTNSATNWTVKSINTQGNGLILNGPTIIQSLTLSAVGFGIMVDQNGRLEGLINSINTQLDSVLIVKSKDSVSVSFNKFSTLGQEEISCISIAGSGSTWLTGNLLDSGCCGTALRITGSCKYTVLTLKLNGLNSSSGKDLIYIGGTSGSVNLSCQSMTANQCLHGVHIEGDNGSIVLSGMNWNLETDIKASSMFYLSGKAKVNIVLDTILVSREGYGLMARSFDGECFMSTKMFRVVSNKVIGVNTGVIWIDSAGKYWFNGCFLTGADIGIRITGELIPTITLLQGMIISNRISIDSEIKNLYLTIVSIITNQKPNQVRFYPDDEALKIHSGLFGP